MRIKSHFEASKVTRRGLLTGTVPAVLIPPTVFFGLLIALWTYKCVMTVLFQDKIIYMSYMPPFTRSEKVADYAKACLPVQWREERISSADGTKIAICVGNIPDAGFASTNLAEGTQVSGKEAAGRKKRVVIAYFHGNGGSVPPRLPMLSNVLRSLHEQNPDGGGINGVQIHYTIIALSYRGYWTSRGRASQKGLELDAQALLSYINSTYNSPNAEKSDSEAILWGQSLGAGVAATAAATYPSKPATGSPTITETRNLSITGLVLETPFTSIKAMLQALYPQSWLPYQYLHPFLWNHWNLPSALQRTSEASASEGGRVKAAPRILLLSASRDEVVPPQHVREVAAVCKEVGLEVSRKEVVGALHNECSLRVEGREAVVGFVEDVVRKTGK